MGPIKTHGPSVLAAIDVNDVAKVTDILTNKFRDKQKTKQFLVTEVRRPQSESIGVPLLAAAALSDPSILRFLVNEQGADVNFVYEHGVEEQKSETALLVAVRKGCCAMADAILSLGGDVNVKDNKGRTPLLLAVRRTDRRMVRVLLSRGARVDMADSDGSFPLHIATVYGHRELVGLLLSYGSDLYQGSFTNGMTAIHMAAREGHAALARMFGELYRADGNVMALCDGNKSVAPIHVAAAEANPDFIRSLIEFCSADPNLKDSDGNTAIHCALLNRCNPALGTPVEDDLVETVRVLVGCGANVNLQNGFGQTPLHLAVLNGFPKVVEVLTEAGCDPNLTNANGERAFDLLAPNDEFSRRLILTAMERSKSDVGSTMGTGKSHSKSKTHGLRSHKSGSDVRGLDSQIPPSAANVVPAPRAAVRKTKSVENLDQDFDAGQNGVKGEPPQPLSRAPRVRSNSVQGPEKVDLDSSNASQQKSKKMGVLKQKKKDKKVNEMAENQPEADTSVSMERKVKVIKPVVDQVDETASLDRSMDSDDMRLNGGDAKGVPPRAPRKANATKNETIPGQSKPQDSKPSLQAWLDEQARLLKEKERADQAGPVAQSTPPIIRSSSKELFESSTNDSDSDEKMLSNRSKLKPPPPPKPKVKKDPVSVPGDQSLGKPSFSSLDRNNKTADKDLENLREVQNKILQRRDSQHSLTGVAQLDMRENSLTYEPSSPPVVYQEPSSANSRLNMSLDSARVKSKSKENRPVPKSRETRPGGVKLSGSVSTLKQELFGNNESALASAGGKPPSVVSEMSLNMHQRPVPSKRIAEETPVHEPAAPRKSNTLVFQRADATASPEKNLGKARTLRDVPDRANNSLKTPVTLSGASLSNSFETVHVAPTDGQNIRKTNKPLFKQPPESTEEEDEDEDEDSEEEDSDEEEDDDDDEEEDDESDEDEIQKPIPQNRNFLNNSISKKHSGNLEVRVVTFHNQDNLGFSVVGGNAEGIFVHAIDPNSDAARSGLVNGDQILRANGQRILGRTKEEATQVLRTSGGQVNLQVRSMPDQYKVVMDNGGLGDGFYVQAQFNSDASKKGELNIHEGDIFSVSDTLPENNQGAWKAHKVTARKNEEQIGTIPNRQRADQIMVKHRLQGKPDQRGGAFFRSFRRSKSAERNSRNHDEDDKNVLPGNSGVVSYQRVVQKLSEFRRPVVVLGLFCDIVISMLIRDSPELFEAPQEEIENLKDADEPVNVRAIRESCRRGKHCLIILTPPSVEYLLQKTDLNPIVVYISPVSKSIVKVVKSKLAPSYNKNAGYMYDEAAKFKKTYNHLFSTSIAYTTDDWWFFHLKEAIGRCQNQPIWRVLSEEELEASTVADLSRICPNTAVLPVAQTRPSRDKTPRVARTTDDLPAKISALPANKVKLLPPLPPNTGLRDTHGRRTDAHEAPKDAGARSILKQRQPGGSASSDQGSIKSGAARNMSVSFDEQESEIPHYVTGKSSLNKSKQSNNNNSGRETLL